MLHSGLTCIVAPKNNPDQLGVIVSATSQIVMDQEGNPAVVCVVGVSWFDLDKRSPAIQHCSLDDLQMIEIRELMEDDEDEDEGDEDEADDDSSEVEVLPPEDTQSLSEAPSLS